MDEQSIKEHLRALTQRSGLTMTNLREHRDLWEKLDLDGPDELRGHIVENLRRLDGTREGASLRRMSRVLWNFGGGPVIIRRR